MMLCAFGDLRCGIAGWPSCRRVWRLVFVFIAQGLPGFLVFMEIDNGIFTFAMYGEHVTRHQYLTFDFFDIKLEHSSYLKYFKIYKKINI
jgi:hypothetical protein